MSGGAQSPVFNENDIAGWDEARTPAKTGFVFLDD
jgi:hypothetical protein